MKNIALLFVLVIMPFSVGSQVGINTSHPSKTLEVNGNVKSDGSFYLENPGDITQIRNSKLLILSPSDYIVAYDIDDSKYGPINYTQFIFRNLSTNGLLDYDTKISIDKYIVTVQGYYFLEALTDEPDIMTHSNISNNNIEGL